MEYISSDTNVWIDFRAISRLELPFRLPYTYIMSNDAIEDELLTPGFQDALVAYGLVGVDITEDEFFLAEAYGHSFPKLSTYDRIALAIAKLRNIVLLTGDMALRKAAKKENVSLIGTIGILDQLYEGRYIGRDEYSYCLTELKRQNGSVVRLPGDELQGRIDKLKNEEQTMRQENPPA